MPEMRMINCMVPSWEDFREGAGGSAPLFKTDIFDGIELADNRCWTIGIEYPDDVESRPQVFLLQYEEGHEDGSEAAIWCYPEDLDAIIAGLTLLREVLREVACEDAKRVPRPNWGAL